MAIVACYIKYSLLYQILPCEGGICDIVRADSIYPHRQRILSFRRAYTPVDGVPCFATSRGNCADKTVGAVGCVFRQIIWACNRTRDSFWWVSWRGNEGMESSLVARIFSGTTGSWSDRSCDYSTSLARGT